MLSHMTGFPSFEVCIIFLCLYRPHFLRSNGCKIGQVQNQEEELGPDLTILYGRMEIREERKVTKGKKV